LILDRKLVILWRKLVGRILIFRTCGVAVVAEIHLLIEILNYL